MVRLPGDTYYDPEQNKPSLPWLTEELNTFFQSDVSTLNVEKTFNTAQGVRIFNVKLERMLDISEKFGGLVVLLYDLTESKRAAIMAERERLARELHDSVTQSLYSLSLFAEWGSGLLAAGEVEPARERMARIGDISQQALREMRLLLYELRPSALDDDGLEGAIESRLTAVEQRVGISAQLQVNVTGDLLPHIEECLYRITQEALNNALKHAEATGRFSSGCTPMETTFFSASPMTAKGSIPRPLILKAGWALATCVSVPGGWAACSKLSQKLAWAQR